MKLIDHLLIILAEECAEVAQRATKAARFGDTEIQPGQGLTNAQRIMDELEDVRVVVELLREEGVLSLGPINSDRFEAKKAKVIKFIEYARQCGQLPVAKG
jgi:NTP pyrophosphatase (non-canonical NTP hydrolase)